MESIKKNLEKVGSSIYTLFDHLYIKIVIITILVIYNSGLFIDFNLQLSSIFNNTILRLLILIIVVAISSKNIVISLLLVLALATSSYYKNENFETYDNNDKENDKNTKKNTIKDTIKDTKESEIKDKKNSAPNQYLPPRNFI
jgi:hypothetical protein